MNLFDRNTYIERRKALVDQLDNGVLLFLGNNESPMNCKDNTYRFRQDSSFRYYFGLNMPGLAATLDLETGQTILYGHDWTIDDIIWVGPQESLMDLAAKVGITEIKRPKEVFDTIRSARQANRMIHYLPPYRHDNLLKLTDLLNLHHSEIKVGYSEKLIKAIVRQRSVKSADEIVEMTEAVNITKAMHIAAMKHTQPERMESEVVGRILFEAQKFDCHLSYPAIFSVNGQTLHNHYHGNIMKEGQLALNDSGAENKMGYAGDITRTFPVNGTFSTKQKDIYSIVLEMEESSIEALRPGKKYRDVHIASNRIMIERFKELQILEGDTEEMLELGIGGLFMPHGLGHMIGLDVHDMEDLGEQYVGYRDGLSRSSQLGLKSLRLAKELEEGFVLTVEPGIYFIPELINKWKAENKFIDHINYQLLADYFDFGGIRIEDNILITKDGHRVLGDGIPKTTQEIEDLMKG